MERELKGTKTVRNVSARTKFCQGMPHVHPWKKLNSLETEEMFGFKMDAKVSSHGIACPSTRTPLFEMSYYPDLFLQAYSALLSLHGIFNPLLILIL